MVLIFSFVNLWCFFQASVALSSIDTDHVCLCGSSKIDGKLKGTKNKTNTAFFNLRIQMQSSERVLRYFDLKTSKVGILCSLCPNCPESKGL